MSACCGRSRAGQGLRQRRARRDVLAAQAAGRTTGLPGPIGVRTAARRTRALSGERVDATLVRTVKSYTRFALGIGILLLGIGWIRSIQHAEHRSRAIQHGRPVTAVIDERRFSSPCLHFTCDQTIYTIRYIAAGRIWHSEVIVDG